MTLLRLAYHILSYYGLSLHTIFLDLKVHFLFMGSAMYKLCVSFILKALNTIFTAAQVPAFAEG
jgi:hypothetical protein